MRATPSWAGDLQRAAPGRQIEGTIPAWAGATVHGSHGRTRVHDNPRLLRRAAV